MTFASRLTRAPLAHDPAVAADVRRNFADLAPDLADLLAATAGCSPYLNGLMAREAGWLRLALGQAPETTLADILAPLAALASDQLGPALRQAKRRTALLTALADLGGVWSLEEVTGALTRLADTAVHLALQCLSADEIRRGKLPGQIPADAATAAGMVALAMGKLGAGELNYSSDIDLILLFDETRYQVADTAEARASMVKITRRLTAMLADATGEGYVFRTDLRLRPDAAVTPVCLSMAAAEHYYESVGRTWERAAYIKARPCGGDLAAGRRFLTTLTPFVWRKHLDFAAIQDAHDMRLRIRDHRGLHGPITLAGHDMKLGQGGIREIEFFTQTRQLIAGGRDPDLRARQTVPALQMLSEKSWVPPGTARDLTALYRAHREVEHRLQMIGDAQTHALPATPEGFDRLARFMGQGDTTRFRADLLERLNRTAALTEGFFAPAAAATGPDLPDAARAIVESWRAYPALRSPRAVEIFKRVRPHLLHQLASAANPEAALLQFDSFLKGLPAGVQVFSLFDSNPQLIDLIVDIAATAPKLARYLARNSAVLDAVIGGSFFAPWPALSDLIASLTRTMADIPDYERKLDAARRWTKEWHFRIGVHHLRGLIDAFAAGTYYADLAEAVLAAVWPICLADFSRKHGAPPGRGAVVLGMGSLGAGRLNAASDLDLIVIYDPGTAEVSSGPRPLATRPYYARLTQGLVTALTAPMAEGKLYEVDMRLRPSGRQGPVATSVGSFISYQQLEAWTWEHLALTRARVLAGDPGLAQDVESFRRALLRQKASGPDILTDVAAMRARIRAAKPADSAWEAKLGTGRLQDIELLAQTAALRAGDPARATEAQLAAGVRSGWLSPDDEAGLLQSYRLCWRVHSAARLLAEASLDPETIGAGGAAFVLRETGAASLAALAETLVSVSDTALRVLQTRLGTQTGTGKAADVQGRE